MRQIKLFVLGLLGVLLSLLVIFIKIPPFRCCTCPPDGYVPYPLIAALIQNKLGQQIDCFCMPEAGCARSFYIIPVDLLVASFILFVLSFTNFKISLSKALLTSILMGVGLSIAFLRILLVI